jgi:hypothetical protein
MSEADAGEEAWLTMAVAVPLTLRQVLPAALFEPVDRREQGSDTCVTFWP